MKVCPSCHTHYPDTLRFCSQDGVALADVVSADPLIGKVAGGTYCLTDRLGSGGFGAVYRAQHLRMPMAAAVKVLYASRAVDPDMVGRFQQEVTALAVLQHPHIVRILDHGLQPDLGYYMAMEFLAGSDVGKALDVGRRFSILEIAAIAEQTLSALDLAHRQGVVHRDVKVENIFLATEPSRPEGFCVKLLDFGLARLTQPMLAQTGSSVGRGNYRSTASRVFGSVATMAPEALTGKTVDARADLYGLGVVLYELFAGEMPYHAMTIDDLLRVMTTTQPVQPTRLAGGVWVPPELEEFLMTSIAREPAQRWQTVAEMRSAFEVVLPAAEKAWARFFLAPEVVAQITVPIDPPLPPLRRPVGRKSGVVLVVDDDKVLRGLVSGLVRAAGCDCDAVNDGLEAVQWLRDHPPPDAIVADLLMPGLDGLSMITAARRAGYDGAVVLCTSVATDKLRSGAAQLQRAWTLDKATELYRVPEILRRAGVAPSAPE